MTEKVTRLTPHMELILGPMNAGKSGELLRQLRRHEVASRKIVAIKHEKDMRNEKDRQGLLNSRDNEQSRVSIQVKSLSEIDVNSAKNTVFGIDEIQFFGVQDALAFCKAAVLNGNIVIAAGLSGDHARNPWPTVSALIPLSYPIEFLPAVCTVCGDTNAPFTFKTSGDISVAEEVGGADLYESVCEACYLGKWKTRAIWAAANKARE